MWLDLAEHAAQHVTLAFSALGLALAAGLPLGGFAAQRADIRGVALALAGIGRTVPSLAVLMLLLPVKILIRHVFRIKYIWITPWFNI